MKKLLFIFLAAGIVSCTQNEIVQVENPADGVDIQLRSVHRTVTSTGTETRAPFIGSIAETNQLTAQVLATKTDGDYVGSGFYVSGDMTFVGGSTPSSYNSSTWSDPTLAKFPTTDNTSLYLAGLYPVAGWTLAGTPATVASYTFNGSQDLMHAVQVTTNAVEVDGGNYQPLTFRHLLSKVELTLKAKTNSAAGAWGKITKVELVKVADAAPKNAIGVNLKSGVATLAATTANMPMYNMSITAGTASYTDDAFAYTGTDGVTLTEAGETVAYSLVQPFTTGTDKDLTFRVHKANGGTVDVDVKMPTITGVNSAGHAFGVTFVFNVDDSDETDVSIQAAATVIDWIPGGNVEKEVN